MSVETEKKVCKWCARPDRKVNVQGYCCQLCYNSALSERMQQSWDRQVKRNTAENKKES